MSQKPWPISQEYYNALRDAGFTPPMTEEEKREKAMAFQAEALRAVTRREHAGLHGVTSSAEDPEIPEHLKTKPNRRENEFMLNLMILRNTLRTNAPSCRERARLAGKWVWRDIRLLTVLVERIQEKLLRTMPESRDDYYRAYAQHGHYELHMNGPVRTARHILMTDKHAAALAEAEMKSECILCMREGGEIKQCELREALLEAAPPTDLQEGLYMKCEYRDAAGALVQGKDVTI